jgi:hypothetical protein
MSQNCLAKSGLKCSNAIDTIVTTHNPALLIALKAEDIPGVVLCYRDEHDGGSKFKAWVDLPDYPALMRINNR